MASDPSQTLTVTARDVTRGRFDPAAYPYRHLAIMQVAKIGTPDSQIPLVMSAVETLARVGWELTGFTMHAHTVVAVMRRG